MFEVRVRARVSVRVRVRLEEGYCRMLEVRVRGRGRGRGSGVLLKQSKELPRKLLGNVKETSYKCLRRCLGIFP